MKLAIALLLMGGMAWGQKAPPIKIGKTFEPAPLKCGKYQHIAKSKGCAWVDGRGNSGQCEPPDYCADNLHTVTEREWQELMARLKKLENPPKGNAANSHYQCLYNYDKLTEGQQHACKVLDMIEARKRAEP